MMKKLAERKYLFQPLENNQEMSDSEKESIMKDFPKPTHKVLFVPYLDDEMKAQIKKTPTLGQRGPCTHSNSNC